MSTDLESKSCASVALDPNTSDHSTIINGEKQNIQTITLIIKFSNDCRIENPLVVEYKDMKYLPSSHKSSPIMTSLKIGDKELCREHKDDNVIQSHHSVLH